MVLQAIKYSPGSLQILDQLQLPHKEVYQNITNVEDAWHAIKDMRVRGAPAIAIVAALTLAVELYNKKNSHGSSHQTKEYIVKQLEYLVTSRPTAVNLADAARKLEKRITEVAAASQGCQGGLVEDSYIAAAQEMLADDVQDNQRIGSFGANWILKLSEAEGGRQVSVLTHCNTGSLATAGYGTALGVVRSLDKSHRLKCAYYTETRPYNQGSRLTGYELLHDNIPCTLITDSMAAALLRLKGERQNIVAIIVGADRVAANGDTANKIGTYALAILAKHHGVKFLVAAPRTTIDLGTSTGEEITIEERPSREMTVMKGPRTRTDRGGEPTVDTTVVEEVSIAAMGTQAWNPGFDVTPADLIDGIVTEVGVFEKEEGRFDLEKAFAHDL
ncbi:S-methyl-5-thioribose-1-phosphate isomerase [Xylographa opegraphella]|nr:S-methyl-5-thioribose-1-phosphate isomerase [Xylographa opegraphella]